MSCHPRKRFASMLAAAAIAVVHVPLAHPVETFGQGGENEVVSRNAPDRTHPMSSWIKQLRKSASNPAIAQSHPLASESPAVCPPQTPESRQTAEAAGSRTQAVCMQVCMKRQSSMSRMRCSCAEIAVGDSRACVLIQASRPPEHFVRKATKGALVLEKPVIGQFESFLQRHGRGPPEALKRLLSTSFWNTPSGISPLKTELALVPDHVLDQVGISLIVTSLPAPTLIISVES